MKTVNYTISVSPREDCYLGYISGKSDLRLDQILFHWRCPAKAEEVSLKIYLNQKYIFFQDIDFFFFSFF